MKVYNLLPVFTGVFLFGHNALAAPDNKMQADDGKASQSTKYISPYKGASVVAPAPKPATVQPGHAPKSISVDKYGNIIEQRPPTRSTGNTVQ